MTVYKDSPTSDLIKEFGHLMPYGLERKRFFYPIGKLTWRQLWLRCEDKNIRFQIRRILLRRAGLD